MEVHHMSKMRPIERILTEPTIPAELQREASAEYVELLTEKMRRVQAEERARKLAGGGESR